LKLNPRDIDDIRLLFEDILRRTRKVDRIEKLRMRAKIRRELLHLMGWRNPTPNGILNRWENNLTDVFAILPSWFREDCI